VFFDKRFELSLFVSTTIASYLIYSRIISSKENLLPDFTTISNEIWIIIILFLYQILNNRQSQGVGGTESQVEYIRGKYRKLNRRYAPIVSEALQNVDEEARKSLEALAYAIMIYEDFNRPQVFRWFERTILYRMGKSRTFGVMQVTSDQPLSDIDSVKLGVEKLKKDFLELMKSEDYKSYWYSATRGTMYKYNPSSNYVEDVSQIYEFVLKNYYPELQRSRNLEYGAG
jgi:hypothetical protein